MDVTGLCSFIGINKESTPQFYVLLGEEETSSDAPYLLWLPYIQKQEGRQGTRIPFTLSKTAIAWLHSYTAEVKRHMRDLLLPGNLFTPPPNNHYYSLISTTHFVFMGTFLFIPISLVSGPKENWSTQLSLSLSPLPNFPVSPSSFCNSTVLHRQNHFHSQLLWYHLHSSCF